MIQLHGSEPIEWAKHIPLPVIRVFHIGSDRKYPGGITQGGAHEHILLDSIRDDGSGVSGGSGKVVDWDLAKEIVERGEVVTDAYMKASGESKPSADSHMLALSSDEKTAPVTHAPEPEGLTAVNGTESHAAQSKASTSAKFLLPIILAGGLTPANVANAIAKVRPWAVDVSGGVENENGSGKDLEKVRAFIKNAKGVGIAPDSEDSDKEQSESGEKVTQ